MPLSCGRCCHLPAVTAVGWCSSRTPSACTAPRRWDSCPSAWTWWRWTARRASELHRCVNAELAACNWMVERAGRLCRSCELTRTRPSDDDPDGLRAFAGAEAAKRRVVMQLLDLGLPGVTPSRLRVRPAVLRVRAGRDRTRRRGDHASIWRSPTMLRREQRRSELGEPYRTMLGHLRHELGHYFQPLLVVGDEAWDACRELFGDERVGLRRGARAPLRAGSRRGLGAGATSAPTRPCTRGRTGPRRSPTICTSATRCRRRPSTASPSRGRARPPLDRSLKATPQPEAGDRGL